MRAEIVELTLHLCKMDTDKLLQIWDNYTDIMIDDKVKYYENIS